MRFIVVTGLSGAGKSTALRFLEDSGYLCVDNLPPAMIMKFIDLCSQSSNRLKHVALAVDIRSGEFFDASSVRSAIEAARDAGNLVDLLFMEADDETLVRRYKETRRDHPLADGEISLSEAITMERDLVQPLRESANLLLDTSGLRVREAAQKIRALLLREEDGPEPSLRIEIQSFGYKRGIPRESDLVFDVRFLPNPFYIPEIKHFTGLEAPVRQFVLENPVTQAFLKKLYDMLDFLLPHYREEGKARLMIAIGCTGGAHRSVAISEALGARLNSLGIPVDVNHRDITLEQASWTRG